MFNEIPRDTYSGVSNASTYLHTHVMGISTRTDSVHNILHHLSEVEIRRLGLKVKHIEHPRHDVLDPHQVRERSVVELL